MAEKTIQDFGEKIGGARKDLWSANGLSLTDLEIMNTSEKLTYATKQNVWPTPDWTALIQSGTPDYVAYWQNEMRKSLTPKCPPGVEPERYVEFAGKIRDAVMSVKTDDDIRVFLKNHLLDTGFITMKPGMHNKCVITGIAEGILDKKLLSASQNRDIEKLKKKTADTLFGVPKDRKKYTEMKNRLEVFCYDERDVRFTKYWFNDKPQIAISRENGESYYYPKGECADKDKWCLGRYFIIDQGKREIISFNIGTRETANQMVEDLAEAAQKLEAGSKTISQSKTGCRKTGFSLPHLEKLEQTGDNVQILHVSTDKFIEDLGFRGGEFGNWISDKERQKNLDMSFTAFKNLSDILGIENPSLGGELAIAFGARGRGGSSAASAHFEPMRQVINLTKLSGAGCLAHEWGHALDNYISKSVGIIPDISMASDMAARSASDKIPETFKAVMRSIKYKEPPVEVRLENEVSKQIDIAAVDEKFNETVKKIEGSVPDDKKAEFKELIGSIYEKKRDYLSNFLPTKQPLEIEEFRKLNGFYKEATGNGISGEQISELYKKAYSSAHEEKLIELRYEKMLTRTKSDFYKASEMFDGGHSKTGHGYWASDAEMFARAFDCYVADKLKEAGIKDDYLSSKSDCFKIEQNGVLYRAYPVGEERALINKKMDNLIDDLRCRGILKEKDVQRDRVNEKVKLSDIDRIIETQRERQGEVKKQEQQLSEHQKSDAGRRRL